MFLLLDAAPIKRTIENPGIQLVNMLHSPLFWFFALCFIVAACYFYYYYVRSSNHWGEEEKYLSADLERKGYSLVDAQKQVQAGPFAQEKENAPDHISITRSSYWRMTAQNEQNNIIELWAKIFYRHHHIVTVKWLPDIQNPTMKT